MALCDSTVNNNSSWSVYNYFNTASCSIAFASDTLSACNQDSVLLDAGSGYSSYTWNTGDTTQTIYANSSGTYSVNTGNAIPVQNNYSMSFDGNDDRVELSNQITEGLTSVTFMAWFNTTDHSGYSDIVQQDGTSGALFIRYNPDGSFTYVFKADQGWRSISISPPSYGVWHHVAMSWDGTNIKAYLDGEEVGSSSGSGTMSGGGPIYIGNWQQQEGFSGKIDDVQYWNIALSESEIQMHMNTELTGSEEGLIGYWNFNEGEGSELIDLSGNGYNGTIYGASWSGDGSPVEPPSYGCTDSYALNYDPNAGLDDGSCYFPEDGNFSLSFDGEANAVDIDVNISGDYTVSGWFNYETANTGNAIVGSSSNDYIRLVPDLNDGSQRFLGYNSPTGANHMGQTALEANQWYHFTVTRAGDELTFFINGEFDGSFSEPSTNLDWVKIGIHRNGWQHGFHGNLDNINILSLIHISEPTRPY